MFLKIKDIPKLSWSSTSPTNLKPSLKTLFFLCLGLVLFGFGEGLLLVSSIGASPWNVLHEGIAINLGTSVGTIAFVLSFFVLLLWYFLDQKIGMGTIINFVIIAIMIDTTMYYFETPTNFIYQLLEVMLGILIIGFGTAIYLIANLGAGPRDGLMTGLQKKTGAPIALVRACIEIAVVILGWTLGGTAGIGTLIFAFGIGLVIGPMLYKIIINPEINFNISNSIPLLIAAGFLVGVGTKIGSGCTSGHGICGISRFSKRSIVATLIFMISAILTVFIKGLL